MVLTDSLGCSLYDAVEIESPDSMEVDVSWSHAGLSDTAQVDLQVTGGILPSAYCGQEDWATAC